MQIYLVCKFNAKDTVCKYTERKHSYTQRTQEEREAKRRAQLVHRRKMRRRRRNQQILVRIIMLAVIVGIVSFAVKDVIHMMQGNGSVEASDMRSTPSAKVVQTPPDYDVELLTINDYSRPATAIDEITGVVVHYTANPGTTAMQNRNYFEGLKDSHDTKASSHFIIGMEGELVQCIPCNEISYASNDRNHDTISIECCIPDDTGKFTQETYDTLVHLVSWLCGRYGLTSEEVIRHYDVTGKMCPKYYVENEDAWEQFKRDVKAYIEENGVEADV